jgi:hypothetical protein
VSLERLRTAWDRRLPPTLPPDDAVRELERVRARAREFEAAVTRRDRIEAFCALLLLPIFAWFAVHAAHPLSRLGSVVLVVACLLIPLRLRLARGRSPDPSLPVASFLRLQLRLATSQRRLLLTVALWYLLPLGVGVVLFVAGAVPWWWAAAYAALVVAFFAYLYRLNRAVVRVEVEPRERELRLWIELLEEPPEEP